MTAKELKAAYKETREETERLDNKSREILTKTLLVGKIRGDYDESWTNTIAELKLHNMSIQFPQAEITEENIPEFLRWLNKLFPQN